MFDGENASAHDRFWSKVDTTGDCWLWTASTRYGYGQFRIGGSGSQNLGAHVIAYTWLVGAVPTGKAIDHLCRVRACVNPAHMEVVTPEENSTRGMVSRQATTELCPNGHRWNAKPVYLSGGYRICGSCAEERRNTEAAKKYHREYQRQWRESEVHREAARVAAREYRRRLKAS